MSRATELFKERGMFPARVGQRELALVEELLTELEELRRIRHVARSYRYAEIECMSYFGPEPRMRSWHCRMELDRLLGIAEELQGLA